MTGYATLEELERTALSYRQILLGEGRRIDAVAERVGKMLRPTDELDQLISNAPADYKSHFELCTIPQLWGDLIGLYLPDENIERWFDDKRAFNGQSVRQIFSVLEPARLSSGVAEVAAVIYEVLSFATVPAIPSREQLYYVTRLAQWEQLQAK